MPTSHSNSLNYKLLKLAGRQPIQILRFFARVLARLIHHLPISNTTHSIAMNLEIALPELSEKQREQITRRAAKNEMLSYFEFLSIWGSNHQKNLDRLHNIHGEAYFHQALKANTGLIMVAPHFGTWEIIVNGILKLPPFTLQMAK